jgi:hypothetical protein
MKLLRRILTPVILPALLLPAVFVLSALAQDVPRMPKEELRAKLDSSDILLIDVRATTDWFLTRKKIKTAVRRDPHSPEKWIGSLPRDKTIVLYCA